mmetsp:Transcript_29057/g.62269  ORF Transcript_29057/g.62269 Transcript_29057/m.62269 type:complete len:97 (-) Transcript_29057:979-1269(-)
MPKIAHPKQQSNIPAPNRTGDMIQKQEKPAPCSLRTTKNKRTNENPWEQHWVHSFDPLLTTFALSCSLSSSLSSTPGKADADVASGVAAPSIPTDP